MLAKQASFALARATPPYTRHWVHIRDGWCYAVSFVPMAMPTISRRVPLARVLLCAALALAAIATNNGAAVQAVATQHAAATTTGSPAAEYEFDNFILRPATKIALYDQWAMRYSHHSLVGAEPIDTFPLTSMSVPEAGSPQLSPVEAPEVALPQASMADMADELVILVRPLLSSMGGWLGAESKWDCQLASNNVLVVSETIGQFTYEQRVTIPPVVQLDQARIQARNDDGNLMVILPKLGVLPSHPDLPMDGALFRGKAPAAAAAGEPKSVSATTPGFLALPAPQNKAMVVSPLYTSLPVVTRMLGGRNSSHSAEQLLVALTDVRRQHTLAQNAAREQLKLLGGPQMSALLNDGDFVDMSPEAVAERAEAKRKADEAQAKTVKALNRAIAKKQKEEEAKKKAEEEAERVKRAANKKWNVEASLASKLRAGSGKKKPAVTAETAAAAARTETPPAPAPASAPLKKESVADRLRAAYSKKKNTPTQATSPASASASASASPATPTSSAKKDGSGTRSSGTGTGTGTGVKQLAEDSSVGEMRRFLTSVGVDSRGVVEKSELWMLVKRALQALHDKEKAEAGAP